RRLRDAGRPARNARNNADDIVRRQGSGFLVHITNVLLVHIDVDEAAQLAIVREQVAAQTGMQPGERAESLGNGGAGNFYFGILPGIGTERRRDQDFHWHNSTVSSSN